MRCYEENCFAKDACVYDTCDTQMRACYNDSKGLCIEEVDAAVDAVEEKYEYMPRSVATLMVQYLCDENELACTSDEFNELLTCLNSDEGYCNETQVCSDDGDCFTCKCYDELKVCVCVVCVWFCVFVLF